jgi:hypothetical protein
MSVDVGGEWEMICLDFAQRSAHLSLPSNTRAGIIKLYASYLWMAVRHEQSCCRESLPKGKKTQFCLPPCNN